MILLILWIIFIYSGQDISKETVTVITNVLGRFTAILPVNFALGAMLDGALWIPLLETIGITAAFVLVAILIVKIFYLNGALSMQDTSSGQGILNIDRKKITIKTKNKSKKNKANKSKTSIYEDIMYFEGTKDKVYVEVICQRNLFHG